jgi:arginine:ornithine antiporter/lysine permease
MTSATHAEAGPGAFAEPALAPAPAPAKKLTLWPLVGLVVGSTIGGGVFNLPGDMSRHASPGAILIGWAITGVGMLCLALVYQGLAMRKPELNSGPYAYARAGFGPYIGFQASWGYWMTAWLGNVSNAVVIFGSLAFFFPIFGHGNNLPSVIGASIGLWLVHALVLKGVKQAAIVNMIGSAANLTPLFAFILIALLAFNHDKLTLNFWGAAKGADPGLGSIAQQVKSTMIVTLWVFIGIEGASVYSGRAAKRSDIGAATVMGFFGALIIYVLVSMVSTGILTQKELAGLSTPTMAGVLKSLVGPWGAALVSAGLALSVSGSFLSWMMLCAETPFAAAKDGSWPRWFAAENAAGSPVNALWLSNGLVQLFLILALIKNSSYQFLYSMASVAILPAYVFSGAYAFKLALSGETYAGGSAARWRDLLVGAVATVYGLWLCYAAQLKVLLLTTILFAPATLVFVLARRGRGQRLFSPAEALLATILMAAAAFALWRRFSGHPPA